MSRGHHKHDHAHQPAESEFAGLPMFAPPAPPRRVPPVATDDMDPLRLPPKQAKVYQLLKEAGPTGLTDGELVVGFKRHGWEPADSDGFPVRGARSRLCELQLVRACHSRPTGQGRRRATVWVLA